MSGQRPLLMVVDDDQGILEVIGRLARRSGYDVVTFSAGREALSQMEQRQADVALVDMRMPEIGGFDVLRAIRQTSPHCQAVMMTGFASVDTAVEAIKLGARDYLTKPLEFTRLEALLNSVREEAEKRRALLGPEGSTPGLCGMIGRGPAMQNLFALVRRLAPHVRAALITGDTGTGKELVSRALHALGPGAERKFVAVNCSAITEILLESELFGHVPGAFAGAVESRPGLFERTEGGTIFLDDVGELTLALQAKLVRALELGEVQRAGSLETRAVDVRVLAATNQDLRKAVQAGRFRGDLLYRLSSVEIKLPPLRERAEDIPDLAASFVQEAGKRLHKPLHGLTPGAERLLSAWPWEGNVRELRVVVDRACILSDGEMVTDANIASAMPAALPAAVEGVSDAQLLATVERDHIQRALVRSHGNKKAAAKMLGLSRRALYRRLERLDLTASITRRPSAATGSLSL